MSDSIRQRLNIASAKLHLNRSLLTSRQRTPLRLQSRLTLSWAPCTGAM